MATIDYKEKYEQALERAKYYHDRDNIQFLENIFPELKESDDERIRKEIIAFLTYYHTEQANSWIAWLEKQGEHANFLSKIQVGDKVTRNEDGVLVNLSQLKRVAKPSEKQGEHKPADKVEPKFKAGNWAVVSTTKGDKVVQIASVEYFKDGYPSYITTEGRWFGNGTKARLLTDKDVETITVPENKTIVDKVEPKFHVGDIVKSKSQPMCEPRKIASIFKDCYWCEDKGCIGFAWEDDYEIVKPKPAENKGMNLVEEEMTPFQKKVFCIIDTTIEEEQGLKQVCDELLALASNEIKQKPAWSEEDEKLMRAAFLFIEAYGHEIFYGSNKEDVLNWLKSLKDRVQPQSQWKPSEEQIQCLYDAIEHYQTNGYPASKLNELYEQMSNIYKL